MVVVAEEIGEEMSCVMLPIGQLGLLVPSLCVAEVLPWRRLRETGNAPDWLVGILSWRGDSIPVVRFEAMNGATEFSAPAGECLVVMNRCRSAHGQPFYAFATDGLPRMVQVGETDMQPEQTHLGIAESAAVKLGAEQVRIPNLGYVEDQLMSLRPGSPAPRH